MKEQLIHILDQSVCLSRKQMKEYLSGTMLPEETHAAEVHLTSCPLCSMAMEGFEEHSEEALQAIASLNSGFLKEHFDNIAPQIHLNSMAPAAALSSHAAPRTKHGNSQPLWRTSSIAAAVLLAVGVLWYVEFGPARSHSSTGNIAMTEAPARKVAEPKPMSDAMPVKEQPVAASSTALPVGQGLAAITPEGQKAAVEKKMPAASQPLSVGGARVANTSNTVTTDQRVADIAQAIPTTQAGAVEERKDDRESSDKMGSAAPSFANNSRAEDMEDKGGRGEHGPSLLRNRAYAMKAAPAREEQGAMDKGDDSYDKGKWGTALAQYKQEMSSTDTRKRHQATIMAARCYVNMGNKAKAIQLLEGLVNEGGPEKRSAKRLLRDLQGD